jgi:hypothetical protein
MLNSVNQDQGAYDVANCRCFQMFYNNSGVFSRK